MFRQFFDAKLLKQVLNEFPALGQNKNSAYYSNPNEEKFISKGEYILGPTTKQLVHFLNSQPFLEFLQELTGIDETLISDPYLEGGGLHQLKPCGFLKIHVDFHKHRLSNLDRRLNVLVYLNKDWGVPQVETLAKGIHAAEPEKLLDYNILAKKKEITSLPIPEKASIVGINDDVTGEGFVLSIQSLANATDFEIWRGTSNTPDALSLEPDQFSYLSTTKRLSYADDTIVKGKRYFYRVRGFNRNGKGEWSAVASRVQ